MASFVYKTAIGLTVILILLQYLNHHTEAHPLETRVDAASATAPKSIDSKAPLPMARDNSENDDELLETANAMVFRPLFVYRQQQAKRQRIYDQRKKNRASRKKSNSYYGSRYY